MFHQTTQEKLMYQQNDIDSKSSSFPSHSNKNERIFFDFLHTQGLEEISLWS